MLRRVSRAKVNDGEVVVVEEIVSGAGVDSDDPSHASCGALGESPLPPDVVPVGGGTPDPVPPFSNHTPSKGHPKRPRFQLAASFTRHQ